MKIVKIKNHESANCKVRIYDDGKIVFQSYATDVIIIDKNGWLVCTGTYSRTTIRQIGWFMHDYVVFPNGEHGYYQLAKKLYEDGFKFNLITGEIEAI